MRLGALEHGLYSGSNSSQSALVISESFITVLFLFLAGTSCAVLCPLDVMKVRLSALYPNESDTSSTNARKHGVLVLLDEEGTKDEEEGGKGNPEDG